jgi:hypothetical protein
LLESYSAGLSPESLSIRGSGWENTSTKLVTRLSSILQERSREDASAGSLGASADNSTAILNGPDWWEHRSPWLFSLYDNANADKWKFSAWNLVSLFVSNVVWVSIPASRTWNLACLR